MILQGSVRSHTIERLGTTSQSSSIAVPAIVKALEDENDGVRRNAVFALARIGRNAADAVEGLQNVLFDANRYVRGDAVHDPLPYRNTGGEVSVAPLP